MFQSLQIQNKVYKRPLLVFAMEMEAAHAFPTPNIVFTGIGKVNAAYGLMKGIQEFKPDLIVNLGTAGSNYLKKGEIACCTSFVQRDMDATPLGFEKFKTPYSKHGVEINYGIKLDNFHEFICGSGDSFDVEHSGEMYQVVDMEAYALALISKEENIPFLCLKYISDGADRGAVDDWRTEVKKAAKRLHEVLTEFI